MERDQTPSETEDLGRLPTRRERAFGLVLSFLLFLLFGAASLVFVQLESLAAALVSALLAVVLAFIAVRAALGNRRRLGIRSIRVVAIVFVVLGVLGAVAALFEPDLADKMLLFGVALGGFSIGIANLRHYRER